MTIIKMKSNQNIIQGMREFMKKLVSTFFPGSNGQPEFTRVTEKFDVVHAIPVRSVNQINRETKHRMLF